MKHLAERKLLCLYEVILQCQVCISELDVSADVILVVVFVSMDIICYGIPCSLFLYLSL